MFREEEDDVDDDGSQEVFVKQLCACYQSVNALLSPNNYYHLFSRMNY